jgi:hypothetical protein
MRNGADLKPRTDWRYFARYSARGDDEALAGQWVTPWTGTEYYVAATMLAEGLVKEGFAVAKGVYDRHVAMGMLYNHIECGEHYFRPLAAWAMLPALQGLVYDKPRRALTIAPKTTGPRFDSLFILPGAWGRVQWAAAGTRVDIAISVEAGALPLRSLATRARGGARTAVVSCGARHSKVPCSVERGTTTVRLSSPVTLRQGDTLRIRF